MFLLFYFCASANANPTRFKQGFKTHNTAETQADIQALAAEKGLLLSADIAELEAQFNRWHRNVIWVAAEGKKDQDCQKFVVKDGLFKNPSETNEINNFRKHLTLNGEYLSFVDDSKAIFGANPVTLKAQCVDWVERLYCTDGSGRNCPSTVLRHVAHFNDKNTTIGFGTGMSGSNFECTVACPKPQTCPDTKAINERLKFRTFFFVRESAPKVYRTESACQAALSNP